jgi:hypothetical protein
MPRKYIIAFILGVLGILLLGYLLLYVDGAGYALAEILSRMEKEIPIFVKKFMRAIIYGRGENNPMTYVFRFACYIFGFAFVAVLFYLVLAMRQSDGRKRSEYREKTHRWLATFLSFASAISYYLGMYIFAVSGDVFQAIVFAGIGAVLERGYVWVYYYPDDVYIYQLFFGSIPFLFSVALPFPDAVFFVYNILYIFDMHNVIPAYSVVYHCVALLLITVAYTLESLVRANLGPPPC